MTLVVPSMLAEHRGVRKTLATLATEVWLLSCVRAHVNLQLRESRVALRALPAGVRTLSAVLCHMDPQAYSLHKGLTTFRAYKRFFTSVRAAVVAQLCGGFVGLVTVWTLKRALG